MNKKIDLGIKVRPLNTKGMLIYTNENEDVVEVQKYINNLQSKIDKAIDKLEKYGLVDKNGNFNAYLDTIELKELYNDLKGDK